MSISGIISSLVLNKVDLGFGIYVEAFVKYSEGMRQSKLGIRRYSMVGAGRIRFVPAFICA
jgi:hypothetical protein